MYKFRTIEENTYYFITNNKVEYNVKFKPSPYVFGEDVIFASYIFELLIQVVGLQIPSEGTDELLPPTIHAIFSHFYKHNTEDNICLYVCESSDGRQEARARKFLIWFNAFANGGFIHINDEIIDSDGTVFPVAVLMRRKNPFHLQVLEAFENLIATYSKDR